MPSTPTKYQPLDTELRVASGRVSESSDAEVSHRKTRPARQRRSFDGDLASPPLVSETGVRDADYPPNDDEDEFNVEDQEDSRAILLHELGSNRSPLKAIEEDPLDDSPGAMVRRVRHLYRDYAHNITF